MLRLFSIHRRLWSQTAPRNPLRLPS